MSNPRVITACIQDAAYARHSDAAVQSTCGVLRNAALLDSDRPLGLLSDEVIARLGLDTATRRVSLSVDAERHAVNRRNLVSQADADFVALHHAEALKNIRSIEPYADKPNRWRLFCDVPSVGTRGLALGLKFVPKDQARSHRDEFWVQTVIPQSAPGGTPRR